MIVVNSNLKIITPKGLAKTAAKSTGKALTEGYRTGTRSEENIYHNMIEPVPCSSSSTSVVSVKEPGSSKSKNDDEKKE